METTVVQPRGAAARQRILRAAEQELLDSGDLQVAGVCRRAKVSMGLPYRYFGNRSGLLIAVVEAFYGRLWLTSSGREYPQATWVERERARIRDWIDFFYAEPLSPMVIGGLTGDGEVAAACTRLHRELVEVGTRNMAHAQRSGELSDDRDPELLAAAVLTGVQAATAVAIERSPRPGADELFTEIWSFVAGAVGLSVV